MEEKRNKAKAFRYKKAIVRDINLDKIKEELWEIQEACDDVRYYFDDETLLNALDGDEDETHEFKMMFSDLCAETEQMWRDLEDEYVPEYFNDFFVTVSEGETLLGFDAFEGDYFGLGSSTEEELARKESRKRMSRLTKEQLMEGAQLCFRIFRAYMGLQYRYDCLKAALDILRDENTCYLQMVSQINEVYETASADGMYTFKESYRKLDDLVNNMPDMAWIQ